MGVRLQLSYTAEVRRDSRGWEKERKRRTAGDVLGPTTTCLMSVERINTGRLRERYLRHMLNSNLFNLYSASQMETGNSKLCSILFDNTCNIPFITRDILI